MTRHRALLLVVGLLVAVLGAVVGLAVVAGWIDGGEE
jgi:hypothetical protein